MGSGAIYAVIVALWAMVLIPMWLRRHDEANESRSVDRYRGAMRSLSRRSAAASARVSSREVMMPARERGGVDVVVTGAGTDPARRRAVASSTPEAVREARLRAAARRRRVLLVLAVTSLLVVVGSLAGVLPRLLVIVPVVLLVLFVVAARRQVRLAADLDRRLARGQVLRARAEQAQDESGRRTRSAAAARRGGRVVEAEPAAPAARRTDDGWDPVSTTLPTYVTAPAASRIPRVIDLTTPGHWTGAAMVEQVRLDRETARVAALEPLFDQHEPAAAEAPAGTFADRFVDDDVVLGLDDDAEFFDQMENEAAVEHRRAVND